MKDVLDAIGYAEATTDHPVACRRPGEPLNAKGCRQCPAWSACKGFGVRYPGSLGTYGDEATDPVHRYRTRWTNQLDQINKMREQS